MDKVLALHAGSRGFDSHRGHMSERFFRSNRPGYPHPVSSELEISGIRVAVGDCSVTERRRWRPSYQTGKTVHVHAKHYKHNVDGRTAPGVCGNGSVPLSHSGNVVARIEIHTHTHTSQSHRQTVSLPTIVLLINTSHSNKFSLSLSSVKKGGKIPPRFGLDHQMVLLPEFCPEYTFYLSYKLQCPHGVYYKNYYNYKRPKYVEIFLIKQVSALYNQFLTFQYVLD